MIRLFDKVLLNDAGATSLEYGIIAALISTAIITTILALGGSVGELYEYLSLAFSASLD